VELEHIIDKALEKDRQTRYQSAAEMKADVKRLARETASGHTTAVSESRVTSRRWIGVATGALALLLAGMGLMYQYVVRQQAPQAVVQRQVTANPSEDPIMRLAISADGKYLAYTDLRALYLRHLDTREVRTIALPPNFCFR